MSRDSDPERTLAEYCNLLQKQGMSARQRHIVVLSGSKTWCQQQVSEIPGTDVAHWITGEEGRARNVHSSKKGARLLGLEVAMLIYDAFAGFDPTVFGAVTGAVISGGLIILLVPELSVWPEYLDPVGERVAVYPFGAGDLAGRYFVRWRRLLLESDRVSVWQENAPVREEVLAGSHRCNESEGTTADQYRAIEAIVRVMRGKARQPLVITGDRGRGKSAALGMASAQLLKAGISRIWVTAPRLKNSEVIFQHCAALLPSARASRNRLEYHTSTLKFLAPDALLQEQAAPDLLLVDEAAAIPTSLLKKMAHKFPKIVFATTVHGYEGNGRGFTLRFQPFLDAEMPQWREVVMQAPVRWSADDPAEQFINRALLLDASAAIVPNSFRSVDDCIFFRADRDLLAGDEFLLAQIFGLLIDAHYETTPMDLRHLLDGPNIELWVAMYQGVVLATAMTAREGGFDAMLSRQVFAGRRRPRGHLLPQLLAAQGNDPLAAMRRCVRIIRIAVHPECRYHGLGEKMLEEIRAHAVDVEFIGASFSLDENVLAFWQHCGFLPLHLGIGHHGVSGSHAVAVAKPVSREDEWFIRDARRFFEKQIVLQLRDVFRDLDTEWVIALLSDERSELDKLTGAELAQLQAVAWDYRGYESSMMAVERLVRVTLCHGCFQTCLSAEDQMLVVRRVLQGWDWQALAAQTGMVGRKPVIARFRHAVGALLNALQAQAVEEMG